MEEIGIEVDVEVIFVVANTVALVVDEFSESYPVACCLSNRTDLTLLLNMFKAIRKKVGIIVPDWIMTDDADQFY